MPRLRSTLRRHGARLLLELLVVVVGVTISFWFQDWRQERADRQSRRTDHEHARGAATVIRGARESAHDVG